MNTTEFYYTMSGSQTDGWSLNVYMYVAARDKSGQRQLTCYWNKPKEFKTFGEMMDEVAKLWKWETV